MGFEAKWLQNTVTDLLSWSPNWSEQEFLWQSRIGKWTNQNGVILRRKGKEYYQVEEYENDEELKAYKKSCFEWKVGKSKGEQISDTRRSGKNENSRIRLHMTKGLRIPVLEQQMGHMGVDKSFNLMNWKYYWLRLYRKVMTYVTGCIRSRKSNIAQKQKYSLTHYGSVRTLYIHTQRKLVHSFVDWLTN